MDNEYFASINEVSKRLSVPAHTLRYWEKQFPVAIRPTTGAGGRRYYRAETVDRLVVIRDLLYKHGMTIAGVKSYCVTVIFPRPLMNLFSPRRWPCHIQQMLPRPQLRRWARLWPRHVLMRHKLIWRLRRWNAPGIY